ncbi:MAG: hypothetical protein AAF658_08510 [Myxococcota bacterium]
MECDDWKDELDLDLAELTRLAEQDAQGWHQILAHHGCSSPRPSEEATALACGFRPTHGAPPSEVQRTLEVFATRVSRGEHEQETRALVDRHHRAYLERVKPKSTLGGIFANAAATSFRAGVETHRVETLRCERCGAGRQKASDIHVCAFCGHRFREGHS